MGFKRARSEEQKQQRMQAILDAADTLLENHAYSDITMQMLADELGFSRANLVHYAETKEEIFLLLYMRDMDRLCADLLASTGGGPMEIEAFAGLFAAACAAHPNFVRLGALLYSILEANISAGRLAVHKTHMMGQLSAMAARLIELFPFLTSETAYHALHALLNYLVGLYPAAHPGEVQREALHIAGFAPYEVDFAATLREFVVVLLRGYRAGAEQTEP